jgi:hypothetical protein
VQVISTVREHKKDAELDAFQASNAYREAAAQRLLASVEPLVESEDDERRFAQARELVNRAMPKGLFGSILRGMATASPQPYERRR